MKNNLFTHARRAFTVIGLWFIALAMVTFFAKASVSLVVFLWHLW